LPASEPATPKSPASAEPAGHGPEEEEERDKYNNMGAEQLLVEIRRMRREHSEQMDAEERARLELEDMLLRIEKHFKAEKVGAGRG